MFHWHISSCFIGIFYHVSLAYFIMFHWHISSCFIGIFYHVSLAYFIMFHWYISSCFIGIFYHVSLAYFIMFHWHISSCFIGIFHHVSLAYFIMFHWHISSCFTCIFHHVLLNENSFCARVQSFTSQRRFSIRGISRVTRGYFLTLFAFDSLVSSVTYLQILTTNLFCGKFYKFQFLKKSLVWKFRNKIFAFKKITHYRIFLNFHHSCRASFPIDI